MNQFVFAFVALLAIACASAKPGYGVPPYTATYTIPAPPPVAYVEIPLHKPAYPAAPAYGRAPAYAPAYAPAHSAIYKPIHRPYNNYGSIPSLLTAAPSNPAASAAAASSTAELKPGHYKQLIVPSWSVLSGAPAPYASHY